MNDYFFMQICYVIILSFVYNQRIISFYSILTYMTKEKNIFYSIIVNMYKGLSWGKNENWVVLIFENY